jgi:RNA polymerase sigma factor (sigma-70 family)
VLADERRAALGRALLELPARDRAVLALRYQAEMSYAEIAERLGATRDQVGVALFRAKARLRRALGEGEER